jgi:apolipoprotein N-acyltransferase
MFQFWLDHLIVNPFQRVEVGPAPWDSLQWFHNFFADIHRLSGFWGLLSAVILVSYIFVRLLYLIKLDRRIGLFLMAVTIPCFFIMNTSVVPEGERQPFLLLLAIGAITEVILGKSRQTLRAAGDNQVPGPSLNEG